MFKKIQLSLKNSSAFSRHNIWSLILLILFFSLYASGISQHNVAYADSDELLTIAYHQGVAHPPGYPIYIFLLNLFFKLPIKGASIAYKGHLLSAIFGSLTVVITFIASWRLYSIIKPKKNRYTLISEDFERWFLSLVTALSLGLSSLFWTYSHVAEKYSFSALLTILTLSQIIKLITLKKSESFIGNWYLLWIIYSFAVSHHHTLFLLLPPLIYLGYLNQKKLKLTNLITAAIISIIFFFLPYLLLLKFNSNPAPISWNFTPTFKGWLSHVSRRQFSGNIYARGVTTGAYLHPIDFQKALQSITQYALITAQSFGWWLILPLIVAIRFAYFKFKKPFIIISIAYLSLGLGLAAYLPWPADWGSQAALHRQYIAGYVIIPFLLWFGWHEIIQRLGLGFKALSQKNNVSLAIAVPIFLGFIIWGAFSLPRQSLKNYQTPHNLYLNILKSVKPDSLLTCYSDLSCFAFLYEQSVNQIRPDVTIIPLSYPLISDTLKQPDIKGFTYDSNPFLMFDIITWNLDKRPVYAVDISSYYYQLLGFDYAQMFYIPLGYYGEISRSIPPQLPQFKDNITQDLLSTKTPNWDKMRAWFKANTARNHVFNAAIYLKMGLRNRARDQLTSAANLFYQYSPQEQAEITGLQSSLENSQSDPRFAPGTHVDSAQEILSYIPELEENNRFDIALIAARGAVSVEPLNIEARLKLAQLYQKNNNLEFAQIEYQNALLIDPDNQSAKDSLSQIEQIL